MAIYSQPQHVRDIVKRCMNHIEDDRGEMNHLRCINMNLDKMDSCDQFIRCQHPDCSYVQSGVRQSVTTPIVVADEFVTIPYQFMCFSSCTGTINRRPIQVLFTLENGYK